MADEIRINLKGINKSLKKSFGFLATPTARNIIFIVLLLGLVIFTSFMRVQNLPLLVDETTGEFIPTALDPFYFLRLAETIVEQGSLPEVDNMRYPSAQVGFSSEILPWIVVYTYKILNAFDSSITLRLADVLSPVIFYAFGLIAFFFLVYILTGSRMNALISSIFLSVIPTYLYRSTAGFADHDIYGMFAFFITLLVYSLSLKYIEKSKKVKLIKIAGYSLGTGFLTAFTLASWGGIANYLFLIVPLSIGIIWIIKNQNESNQNTKMYIIYYGLWIASTIFFGLIYGFSLNSMITRTIISLTSMLVPSLLLFMIVDYFAINLSKKGRIKHKKYRIIYSLSVFILIGLLFLVILGGTGYVEGIVDRLIHPFGEGRTSMTVSESRPSYLNDWIEQTGNILFWLLAGGLILIGAEFSKRILGKKEKVIFFILWIFMLLGVMFSRISGNSILNGENFLSNLFYIGSLVVFSIYALILYLNKKVELSSVDAIIFSWLMLSLISVRGAVRLFFVMSPFVCFSAGYLIVKLPKYIKKTKDDLLKIVLFIILIVVLVASLFSLNNLYSTTSVQAKYTGPSANSQWQYAMEWVRDNTLPNSIFIHWWDYGYWVEYLGERPAVTDGGHAVGYWDHLIGRYLLTTPYPESALSLMKSHNVSYILIDPTDLGKYGAYSKIGSDENGEDRYTFISTLQLNENYETPTENGRIIFYEAGYYMSEDVIYEDGGVNVFIPKERGAFMGIALEIIENENSIEIEQPLGIFIYNGKQMEVPIRYVYYDDQITDFGKGMGSIARILPSISQSSNGDVSMNKMGTVIYIPEKASKSLFSQIYLMDDPWNNYPTLNIAHSEDDPVVKILKTRGGLDGESLIYYGGFRGPIRIWEVNYPSNILENEEFLRTEGKYAELDNFQFLK